MKTCKGCTTPKKCMEMGKCLIAQSNENMKMDPQYKSAGGIIYKGR